MRHQAITPRQAALQVLAESTTQVTRVGVYVKPLADLAV
jgi:hypothetical protein